MPATKRRSAPKPQFSQEETIDALASIAGAMEMAAEIIDEGEAEHYSAFMRQLRAWGIAPLTFPDEPYLDEVKFNFAYQFVRVMERLFVRVESYLHDGKKSGVSYYTGESREMQLVDRSMEWKAFSSHKPLVPQVNQRIMTEAERVQTRLQRNLDACRQAWVGVEEYIWRSRDDDKVRAEHAEYDDRVFRWDSPPPGGHPGTAYGCRCYAEPIKPRIINDPPLEPVYPELIFIGIGRAAWVGSRAAVQGIRAITRKVGERLARYRAERLARQTTKRLHDILMPDGKPIGKRGDRHDIRVIKGGEKRAKELFDRLTKDGKDNTPPDYPGKGKQMPNGDWIGYRPQSKHGEPAIDIKTRAC